MGVWVCTVTVILLKLLDFSFAMYVLKALTAAVVAAACARSSQQDAEAVGAATQANIWLILFPAAAFPRLIAGASMARVRRVLWQGEAVSAKVTTTLYIKNVGMPSC